MAKIQFVCDTVCDLPVEYIRENKIRTIKIPCIINGEEVFDISNIELFEYVKNNGELPKTAAPSLVYYESCLAPLCEENEQVIFLSMSSGISSAYMHIKQLEEKYKNLHIIDSKNLSGGIALLMLYSIQKSIDSTNIDELVEHINDMVNKIKSSFILDTLAYLHKGGRCSTLSLLGANLLRLKPQITLNDGKMLLAKKFKGKIDSAVKDYCDYILNDKEFIDKHFVVFAFTIENDKILQYLESQFRNAGIENIIKVQASFTIACHCGPNTFGIFYLQK